MTRQQLASADFWTSVARAAARIDDEAELWTVAERCMSVLDEIQRRAKQLRGRALFVPSYADLLGSVDQQGRPLLELWASATTVRENERRQTTDHDTDTTMDVTTVELAVGPHLIVYGCSRWHDGVRHRMTEKLQVDNDLLVWDDGDVTCDFSFADHDAEERLLWQVVLRLLHDLRPGETIPAQVAAFVPR
jgi:hypothetical protein